MFMAVGIAAKADHAGAADEHDPRRGRKNSMQGGAFIPRHQHPLRVQLQGVAQQLLASLLKCRALFNAAGAHHGGIESGVAGQVCRAERRLQAGADGIAEARFTISCIEVANPAALSLCEGAGGPSLCF